MHAPTTTGLTFREIPRCAPEPSDQPAPGLRAGAVPRRVTDTVDPAARAFAVSALTMVLEVMDRRRPLAHLTGVAVGHIVDQIAVLTAARVAQVRPGAPTPTTASLARVHLQWAGPDAAEVTATYARGPRVHAVAARIQQMPVRVRPATPNGPRRTRVQWMLVNVTTV
ncbi:Rv3235 family protein [Williamsia deligens]|uniref:Rv3235 family protein n=1 Tax=Williamsia deligens TaxID=321325 RepID=A0ABW3G6R5_9NOCA|nr:Rv3235 family protein [Williamsia deligens]MCP2194798.1 hypothetical protein [Williamsia deligens]